MKHSGVTLKDLADELNLSVYTVSRAINGLSGVSETTRGTVLKAAESKGYIPNANARDLRKGLHHSVTLLTAGMSNPYYLDLISGIESVFQSRGENLFISDLAVDGHYTESSESQLLQQILETRPGGIISTLALSDSSRARLREWNLPVVFVDSVPGSSHDDFSYVTTDNKDASAKLGNHLAQHHFKKWLLAIYPAVWNSRYIRESGLKLAAQGCGAEINVLECQNDQKSTQETIERFLDANTFQPDVIIAGNNPILQGVMTALQGRKIQIPDDLALVAFDDFTWSDLLTPRITLVAEDSYGIGAKAADHMLALINQNQDREGGEDIPDMAGDSRMAMGPIHQTIEASLKIRESCGCEHPMRGAGSAL